MHVFEQRYRDLVTQALATDGVIALAQVLPGYEAQLLDKPELEPMACAGVIGLNEQLEDGRFNLLVMGVARARLMVELPSRAGFREFEADIIEEPPLDAGEDEALRSALFELVARLPPQAGESLAAAAARLQGGALADAVASALFQETAIRFEILQETDPRVRVREVAQEVLRLVAQFWVRKPKGIVH